MATRASTISTQTQRCTSWSKWVSSRSTTCGRLWRRVSCAGVVGVVPTWSLCCSTDDYAVLRMLCVLLRGARDAAGPGRGVSARPRPAVRRVSGAMCSDRLVSSLHLIFPWRFCSVLCVPVPVRLQFLRESAGANPCPDGRRQLHEQVRGQHVVHPTADQFRTVHREVA